MKKNYIKILVTFLLSLMSQVSTAQISETSEKSIDWNANNFTTPTIALAAIIPGNTEFGRAGTVVVKGNGFENVYLEVRDINLKLLRTYQTGSNLKIRSYSEIFDESSDITDKYITFQFETIEEALLMQSEGVRIFVVNNNSNESSSYGYSNILKNNFLQKTFGDLFDFSTKMNFFWKERYTIGQPSVICIDGDCTGTPPGGYLSGSSGSTSSGKQLDPDPGCDGCNWDIEVTPNCIGCSPGVYYGPLSWPSSTDQAPALPFDIPAFQNTVPSSYQPRIDDFKKSIGKYEIAYSDNFKVKAFSSVLAENYIFKDSGYKNFEHLHEVGINKLLFVHEYLFMAVKYLNKSNIFTSDVFTSAITLAKMDNLVKHPSNGKPIGLVTLTNTHGAFFEAREAYAKYPDFNFYNLFKAFIEDTNTISYSGIHDYHNRGLVMATYGLYWYDGLVLLDEYFKKGYKFDNLMNLKSQTRHNILSVLSTQNEYIINNDNIAIVNEKLSLSYDLITYLAQNTGSLTMNLGYEGTSELMKAQYNNLIFYKDLGQTLEFANQTFFNKLDLFGLENLAQFNGYEDYVLDVFSLDESILSELNDYLAQGEDLEEFLNASLEDYITIEESLPPSMQKVLCEIMNLKNPYFRELMALFDKDQKVNIKFEAKSFASTTGDPDDGNEEREGETDLTKLVSHNEITISINDNLDGANPLFIASTMLHEIIHAQIGRYVYYEDIGIPYGRQELLTSETRERIAALYDYYPSNTDAQHLLMAESSIKPIAQALWELDGKIRNFTQYLPLAWDGLLRYAHPSIKPSTEGWTELQNKIYEESNFNPTCP